MEGLELIRLFSDSKEKFVELRLLAKSKHDADYLKLVSLKEWFESGGKSIEKLLAEDSLKFVDKMLLEKLERDFKESIKKIDSIIKSEV